jgi:hypothetical protein
MWSMRWQRWAAAAAVCPALVCPAPVCTAPASLPARADAVSAAGPACEMKRYASLDLLRLEGGLIAVPVRIQDSDAFMVLNLAGSISKISSQAVAHLGLPLTAVPADVAFRESGTQGKKTYTRKLDQYAATRQFSIGELRFPDQQFLVDPQSTLLAVYGSTQIVGTLASDLLWRSDLELDLARAKLNLYAPSRCGEKVVYWAEHAEVLPLARGPFGDFYFTTELNGKKLETALSTLSDATILASDAARVLYGIDGAVLEDPELAAGRLRLTGERVELRPRPNEDCPLTDKGDGYGYIGCFGSYPLMLGREVLNRLHLYVSARDNRMYFTD